MNSQSNRGFILKFHCLNSQYKSIQINLNKNYNAKYNYFEMKSVTTVLESFRKFCIDLLKLANVNFIPEIETGLKRSMSAFKERSIDSSLIKTTPKAKEQPFRKSLRQDFQLPRVKSTKAKTSKDKLIDDVNLAVKNLMHSPIPPDHQISRFNKFISYKDSYKNSVISPKLSSSNLKNVPETTSGFRNEMKIYAKPSLYTNKNTTHEVELCKSLSQVQLTDNSHSRASNKEKAINNNQKKETQSIELNSKFRRSTSITSGITSPQPMQRRSSAAKPQHKPSINISDNDQLEPTKGTYCVLNQSKQASPQISKMLNNFNKRISTFKARGLDLQLQD